VGLTCVACVALVLGLPRAAIAAPPNIVIVIADDLGWNDVGYHGSEIATPHIDRIAREGIELDRFYVFPTCSPTRAALMTANSPVTMGLHAPVAAITRGGLPLEIPTLPERLREAGYVTALVGKWHLGHARPELLPNQRGFDRFLGHVTGGIGYWNKVHTGRYDWQRDGRSERDEGYSTELIGSEAVRVIEERDRDRPLFLQVAFNAPHLPNEAPDAYVERYAHVTDPNRRLHAAMVAALDDQIGVILEVLQREGIAEQTLVLFFSDNGGTSVGTVPEWVQSAVDWSESNDLSIPWLERRFATFREGGSSNAPLRGGKVTPWEGGIRVPAALWWPSRAEGGAHDGLLSVHDVMPTLFTAAELPLGPDPGRVGESRWEALRGGSAQPHGDVVMQSVLDRLLIRPPWKLVLSKSAPWQSVKVHLYRPWDDPREEHNLADQHPELVEAMRSTLDAFPTGAPVTPPSLLLFHMDVFGGEEDDDGRAMPWAELASSGAFEEAYAPPLWPLAISAVGLALLLQWLVRRWRRS